MMSDGKTLNILTEDKIQRILKRMSIQILENNLGVSKVVLVGITGQGPCHEDHPLYEHVLHFYFITGSC